jgi:hypothetical protein
MKKIFALASILLLSAASLIAQAALTNTSIVKMSKAGLSDDVITATITASAGNFDTTPDALVALKKAGISDKIIALLVQKNSAPPAPAQAPAPLQVAPPPAPAPVGPPRVFLTAQNSGASWMTVLHNQVLEMSKDFGRDCPRATVTVNEKAADYTLSLNHIESGFYRDNQMQASNRSGDVIAPPVKNESIANGVKRVCDAILADWAAKGPQPAQ